MHYVEVLVADASYHGTDALTYASDQALLPGQIVVVPLRNKQTTAVVIRTTNTKPHFVVKPIILSVDLPLLPKQMLALAQWMQQYYPASTGTTLQHFMPKEFPKRPISALPEAPFVDESNLHPLTNDQKKALTAVSPTGMSLVHGDTGTGKTRLYIEIARNNVAKKQSTIILTPEIGLTSQIAKSFQKVFGDRVVILHSQLSESVRRKLWVTVLKETEPLIIVGPRSALFSPVRSIGAIIIDEAHETAYKQDQSPYYHATFVAAQLAHLYKAPLILGTATPLVHDYFIAEQKNLPIIRMTETAAAKGAAINNTVEVIDLSDRDLFKKSQHLSMPLIAAVKQALDKGEQTLLFLNRRGTARVILCEQCGWQAVCPHCDLPLVYHHDSHSMRCHTCDFHNKPPVSCPECSHASVIFKTVGTKAITEEVKKLFPEARVQRFDTDNKSDERLERHHSALENGDVDIIIGTQSLVKGMDFPKLSVVGVLIADTSLFVPDFSSQERTYQLLRQVIGRVGRGHRDGFVFLQTYQPKSPLIRSIITNNWDEFYQNELKERKAYLFPPYCYLLKIWCRRASPKAAEKAALQCRDVLREHGLQVIIEGPAPSFHEKAQGKYQWQLIIKAKKRSELLRAIKLLPANWHHDIDPMNLL